jgi:hypothetical protein
MTRGHKQQVICKKISVDAGIAPLIEWMNNLNGVVTQFSCEGKKKEISTEIGFSTNIMPYVAFYCFNHSSLYYVFEFIAPYAETIRVGAFPKYSQNRYSFYFKNKKDLKACIQNLPEINMDIYDVNGMGY